MVLTCSLALLEDEITERFQFYVIVLLKSLEDGTENGKYRHIGFLEPQ